MNDAHKLAKLAGLYRDGPLHPLIVQMIEALEKKNQNALQNAEEPKDCYRHQGALKALAELKKLLTVSLAQDSTPAP